MAELLAMVRQLGLAHLQLALGPLLSVDEPARQSELAILRSSDLTVTAGMIGFPGEDYSSIPSIHDSGGFAPDELWPARRDLTIRAGELAASLGLKLLTAHVGFVPPSNHRAYPVMVERVRELATKLAKMDISLAMETGQEAAPELLQFINDVSVRTAGVNFDPANMVLYGAGEPIDAIATLGRHIMHVHAKDAVRSSQPGLQWGTEVPFGTGQVHPQAFLEALKEVRYTGPIVIEREAGKTRVEDVLAAVVSLRNAQEVIG